MDCSARSEQPHAVCVPTPAQGHMNAMLQLAKLLHCRGFHITFVHTDSTYNRILATSGPSSLAGLPGFCFDAIPDGLQSSDPINGEEIASLCDTVRNSLAKPFRELLKRLNESRGPKVSCIVSDTFSSYTLEVAADLGIPDVSFCSVSACSFWGFFKYEELMEKGIIPLKSKYMIIKW